MSDEDKPVVDLTEDEVKARIERQRKLRACRAELDEVLERHGVALAARPEITPDGRLGATVGLVVKE